MIILKEVTETTEGTWFPFKFRGEEVELKIRPYSSEVYEGISSKYTKKSKQIDPKSRSMISVEVSDDDAITDEFVDYLLEDFKGFASAKDTPLVVNLRNKKRIVNLPTLHDYETSIGDFLFNKSRELAVSSEKDDEETEKN